MSRAEALVQVIADKAGMWTADEYKRVFPNLDADDRDDFPEDVARAICEHLGWTWKTYETLQDIAQRMHGQGRYTERDELARHAGQVATLLEAAGIPRDGETT